MRSLPQLMIPRKVLPTHLCDEASLQVFCDTSEKAYGACVYQVSVKDDIVSSTLISSKCKVAPIKPSTLPGLEFLAFHLCAKHATAVKGTIKIKARIEHLCAVLRLNNRPLIDQSRPGSIAYVCFKPRVPNSVNAPNN